MILFNNWIIQTYIPYIIHVCIYNNIIYIEFIIYTALDYIKIALLISFLLLYVSIYFVDGHTNDI